MDILLTGHKGYIGSHLCRHLQGSGHTVTGFDALGGKSEWEVLFDSIPFGTFDVVIHCGAIADSLYSEPDIFFWNYETTRRIADILLPHTKLIFFSSWMAIKPENLYGWTKRCSEDYIRATVNNYCILQIFNVYGGVEKDDRPSVPRQLMDGTLKYLFKDFGRDYIHVTDICRAVCHVIENKAQGIFEVGTGRGASATELADITGWGEATLTNSVEVLGKPVPKCVVAKASEMLPGFEPVHDVRSYLQIPLGDII